MKLGNERWRQSEWENGSTTKKLKNGDQVEIITGNKVNLNPDWIDDVVTHKANQEFDSI